MVVLPQLKPTIQILDSSWNSNISRQQRNGYVGGKETQEMWSYLYQRTLPSWMKAFCCPWNPVQKTSKAFDCFICTFCCSMFKFCLMITLVSRHMILWGGWQEDAVQEAQFLYRWWSTGVMTAQDFLSAGLKFISHMFCFLLYPDDDFIDLIAILWTP